MPAPGTLRDWRARSNVPRGDGDDTSPPYVANEHRSRARLGLVVRATTLIYPVAFWSLRREVPALCGSRGLTPVAIKLARMRQDMGLVRCLLRHPSFLWGSSCDAALVWLARAGMASAALAWAGRRGRCCPLPGSRLSFDVAIGMTFPWESRLFEAGLLAILLPPLQTLPDVRTSVAPDPLMLAPAARSRL